MADKVFDIVAPVLKDLIDAENEDRMDVDREGDQRTEREM